MINIESHISWLIKTLLNEVVVRTYYTGNNELEITIYTLTKQEMSSRSLYSLTSISYTAEKIDSLKSGKLFAISNLELTDYSLLKCELRAILTERSFLWENYDASDAIRLIPNSETYVQILNYSFSIIIHHCKLLGQFQERYLPNRDSEIRFKPIKNLYERYARWLEILKENNPLKII